MIEPQVLHGGASSWFRIAANSEALGFGASLSAGVPPSLVPSFVEPGKLRPAAPEDAAGAEPTVTLPAPGPGSRAPSPGSRVPGPESAGSSRMFTPTRNCASGDRNLVAIQRKM